jgi:predicted DNA-binding protein
MYSPKIPEHLIPRLYQAAKAQKRPMTQLVAEAIQHYLDSCEHIEVSYALTKQGRDLLRRTKAA